VHSLFKASWKWKYRSAIGNAAGSIATLARTLARSVAAVRTLASHWPVDWPVDWPLHWPAHWPAASLRRVIFTRRVPTSRTTHSRHLFRTSLFLFSTGQFCKERVEPLRFVRGTARAFPVLLFSVARKSLCPSRWTVRDRRRQPLSYIFKRPMAAQASSQAYVRVRFFLFLGAEFRTEE